MPGLIAYSNTPGNVPTSLGDADIGINQADGRIYYRSSSGAVTLFRGAAIVEAATPLSFPATGAAGMLYLATDSSRLYRWVDASTKYVEVGPVGSGGGSDSTLWSLFLPPAPTSVTGTSGDGQVVLSWTAPAVSAQTPITSYTIQRSENGGTNWYSYTPTGTSVTSATLTGLTNGTAYIFRVLASNAVGSGPYSAASASVTPGGDPLFSSVALLLHLDGANGSTTITDSSGTPKTITRSGGAAISTAQSRFGGASLYLNGTTDALSFSDVSLGTGDFCVEMFFRTASSVQYAQLIGNEASGGASGYTLLLNNNSSTGGQIALYRQGNFVLSSSSGDWSDDAWHHVALVRSGTTVTLWIDGTSYGTATDSNSYSGGTYYIGRNNEFAPRNVVGYIDEVRITKGAGSARYTSTFTPPSAPFPNS